MEQTYHSTTHQIREVDLVKSGLWSTFVYYRSMLANSMDPPSRSASVECVRGTPEPFDYFDTIHPRFLHLNTRAPRVYECPQVKPVITHEDLREIASVVPLLSSGDFIPVERKPQIMMLESAYESWEGGEISPEECAIVQATFLYMMKREEKRSGEISSIGSLEPPPPPPRPSPSTPRRGGLRSHRKRKPRVQISLAPPAENLPDPRWVFGSSSA
ncbi:hypothetical protein BDP27DRAFT_1427689 [Rhodocollybia butyracea]|uniref:Uncharacterized protein n=1 Tax=Rhodocollybia butyracea TaxID=206335 RepID=A0A9P5PG12_9AGAR|nr:hypothetical protein BDP27DRAFT_1427689 [Rhodocollybia butyracea]